jgi:hypothetical protein
MKVWKNLLLLEDLLIGGVYESKICDCKTKRPAHSAQATLPTTARGRRLGSRRTSWKCGRRRSDLPAPLYAALWTILHGASLNWGSGQSFITKPRTWSRRSGRWWGPSPGTQWRRPARSSGPGLRLSSLLTAVLLYVSILSICLCQPVFNSIKSYGFQLWCVILKKQNENSGFIAATLYF